MTEVGYRNSVKLTHLTVTHTSEDEVKLAKNRLTELIAIATAHYVEAKRKGEII